LHIPPPPKKKEKEKEREMNCTGQDFHLPFKRNEGIDGGVVDVGSLLDQILPLFLAKQEE